MQRIATLVAVIVAVAGLTTGVLAPGAAAAGETFVLTAGRQDPGWVAFAARGADGAAVTVHERLDGRLRVVARLSLRGGHAEPRHGVRWRCGLRTRRFVATATGAGGEAQTSAASITTPSCAQRLRLTVLPAQVRTGEQALVRVSDGWRLGAISAKFCARLRSGSGSCRTLRLGPGTVTRRVRMRLGAPGRWTIALRSRVRQRITREVHVRPDARLQVLVTGDSMIGGLPEALSAALGARASVVGDPHPGRGLTTPGFLNWPAHARRTARDDRPDVTVVLLGAADAGYPLTVPTGEVVACCEPAWITAYGAIARGMMASYLRDGRGLVYWVLLPAPRSATRARVWRAQNEAIRWAASGADDGVSAIARLADVLSPDGVFHESILVGGRRRIVRDADGIHLSALGIRIATGVLTTNLRRDGLTP